jgi:hypothetical protein
LNPIDRRFMSATISASRVPDKMLALDNEVIE